MPGLLRGVARTAVVAGTATAVSGRVQRRQAEKFAGRDAQIYADREQAYQQQAAAAPAPAPAPAAAPVAAPAAAGADDMLDQLERLGRLRTQGILTDEEFAAQKAKILNG
jgi:predicted cobalt transporter CbtA